MKSVFKNIWLISFLFCLFQTQHLGAQKFNDLILILDPEKKEEDLGALFWALTNTLQEKSTPIIVPGNIVIDFGLKKVMYKKELDAIGRLIKDTDDTTEIYNEADKQVVKINSTGSSFLSKPITAKDLVLLSVTDFLAEDWYGYIHKTDDLVLLIPKNYIMGRCGVLVDPIKECGFRIDDLEKISNVSPAGIKDIFMQRYLHPSSQKSVGFVSALKSMFTYQSPYIPPAASWNIYLVGHGAAAFRGDDEEAKNILKQKIEELSQQKGIVSAECFRQEDVLRQVLGEQQRPLLGEYNEQVQETLKVHTEQINSLEEEFARQENKSYEDKQRKSLEIVEETNRRIRLLREELNERFQPLQAQYDAHIKKIHRERDEKIKFITAKQDRLRTTLYDNPSKIPLVNTARIAGLLYKDFFDLMKFFDEEIQVSFVYYTTCFGGGYNQALVNDILRRLNVRYLVASEGIAELSTRLKFSSIRRSGDGTLSFSMHYYNFFTSLKQFFNAPHSLTEKMKAIRTTRKDPLAAIVKNVAHEDFDANNQPFIRIPRVGVFGALHVDENVKILTDFVVRAYTIAGQPIDMSAPGVKAVLIYPNRVNAPIKLGANAAIISTAQTELSQSLNKIYIFEDVAFEDTLSTLIYNFIRFNSTKDKITFLIKKLTCLDYEQSSLGVGDGQSIALENMIIQITAGGRSRSDSAAVIDIVFMYNNIVYQCLLNIVSFELKNRANVKTQCNNLQVSIATSENVEALSKKVLEFSDIEDMQEPITFTALIQKIDDKVEKSVQGSEKLKRAFSKAQARIRGRFVRKSLLNRKKLDQTISSDESLPGISPREEDEIPVDE